MNLEKWAAVREIIGRHPEQWNQMDYYVCEPRRAGEQCSTWMCVAGWTVHLDGWRFPFSNRSWIEKLTATGIIRSNAHTEAKDILELTEGEADRLFNEFQDHDLEALDALVERIASGEVQREIDERLAAFYEGPRE